MSKYSPVPHVYMAPPVIENHTPAYLIKEECYLDDTRYVEGEYLYWPDTPNLSMSPVNQKAEEEMEKYIAYLDECGRRAAEKAGKHYNSYADAFENARVLEQQSFRGRIASHEVPLMGEKKKKNKGSKIDVQPQAAPLLGGGRKTVNSIGKGKVSDGQEKVD